MKNIKNSLLTVLCVITFIGFTNLGLAQDGTNDPSFNPGTLIGNTGLFDIAIQDDGKIVIGGRFFIDDNGTFITGFARLNPDGTLDNTFNIGTGANDDVNKLLIQPDGKIIIVGNFTSVNGTSINRVARINPDGSLDNTFNVGTGSNSRVVAVDLQEDGKLVLGVSTRFTNYNGNAVNRIFRVNSDGSFDPTLANLLEFGGARFGLSRITILENGKILFGGTFETLGGVPQGGLVLFNSDGSVDNTFNAGVGPGAFNGLFDFAIQPDGKVILVGPFNEVNGEPISSIARLNPDGSLDNSFGATSNASSGLVSICLQSDGKIIIGGGTVRINNITNQNLVRLNPDGSVDTDFERRGSQFPPTTIQTCAIQSDGKIVIGGAFSNYDGVSNRRIARVNSALPCNISNPVLEGTTNCIGENASFTVSFDVVAGSGNYDLIATEANLDLGITENQVLGSIDGGMIAGDGLQITGTILATTTASALNVQVIDRDLGACTIADPILIDIPVCVASEPLPTMSQWYLMIMLLVVLGSGILFLGKPNFLKEI
ncbi:MAG: hypothetical protein Sapg2KO_34160 [Saprospiraceae bacterium]